MTAIIKNSNSCPVCGKPLGRNKNACSRACYSKFRSNTKTCIVCGNEFFDPPSSDTVTCCDDCSSVHRQQLHKDGVYAGSLDKAHEAAKVSPLTGRFETHMHAKTWVIKSPSGDIYKCRNLLNWLRQHEDLLDGTARQAWDGITKIKYTMQGKRKNPSHSWKGWRLIEYGEK